MNSYLAFLSDYEPEFLATEASVYNRTERYAGTLDNIMTGGKFGGRRVIEDTKTSKGVYPEVALQLSAYKNSEFIGLPDGSEEPMIETDGAVCLHLTDSGYELIEVDVGPEVFTFFLYAREVFRWQETNSKNVLLGPYPVSLEAAGLTPEVAA